MGESNILDFARPGAYAGSVKILTEATLVKQPEKTELEYRVIAVNKSGEGQPSNTVMVVL